MAPCSGVRRVLEDEVVPDDDEGLLVGAGLDGVVPLRTRRHEKSSFTSCRKINEFSYILTFIENCKVQNWRIWEFLITVPPTEHREGTQSSIYDRG